MKKKKLMNFKIDPQKQEAFKIASIKIGIDMAVILNAFIEEFLREWKTREGRERLKTIYSSGERVETNNTSKL